MRQNGFVPHRFLDIKRWSIAPTIRQNNFRIPFNQLLEADLVYIKDPLNLESCTVNQIKILAIMADNFFKSPDLTIHCMRELVRRKEIESSKLSEYLAL